MQLENVENWLSCKNMPLSLFQSHFNEFN